MYHRVRRKMKSFVVCAILLLAYLCVTLSKTIDTTADPLTVLDESFDNNIVDSNEGYSVKYSKKYGAIPWHASDYKKHRYTVTNNLESPNVEKNDNNHTEIQNVTDIITIDNASPEEITSTTDFSVIPLELLSTTEDVLISILESTVEPDLTVIPLSTTHKPPTMVISQTVTLPSSTQDTDTTTDVDFGVTDNISTVEATETTSTESYENNATESTSKLGMITKADNVTKESFANITNKIKSPFHNTTTLYKTDHLEVLSTNSSKQIEVNRSDPSSYEQEDEDVPIFTQLDAEDAPEVPEDYYDAKDIVPTSAPKTDALSVIFGLAGSVVESVAERVVPKTIYDLFKRMQKQNEALEAERLRSREENGGIGQFGRGILKTISTGLSKPLSQLMAGAGDAGSLDSDRGFVGSLASGVSSVANVATSVVDAFKDRVQAIYPGTVWCGDGRSATARSSDLGLFFFTDTCCRQHDACKMYIRAGETKHGLTNTGLFTRSHCSCDSKFRECLMRTNSLVSSQIGLTYFNVLGPQCFRRTHPIVRCVRRTRITGQKCEEYELDYTKPKMWQWFDNETF